MARAPNGRSNDCPGKLAPAIPAIPRFGTVEIAESRESQVGGGMGLLGPFPLRSDPKCPGVAARVGGDEPSGGLTPTMKRVSSVSSA